MGMAIVVTVVALVAAIALLVVPVVALVAAIALPVVQNPKRKGAIKLRASSSSYEDGVTCFVLFFVFKRVLCF